MDYRFGRCDCRGFFAFAFFLARYPLDRPVAYVVSVLMIANGLNHFAGTILGRTVESVHFPRPMPGFYSSPTMIAASIYVLVQLRNTKRPSVDT
jgi:hypothetical protein